MSPSDQTLQKQMELMQALMQVRQRWPDARLEPNGVPGGPFIFVATEAGLPCWIPFLSGTPQSCSTLQEARRRVNVHAVTHLAWPNHPDSLYYQAFGPSPREALPPLHDPPARLLFEAHDLRRIPVTMDEQARTFLDSGNQQTRLLVQALSEAFGALQAVERMTITWREVPEIEVPVLEIQAEGPQARTGRWLLRTDELLLRLPTTEVAHQAHQLAAELVRLYLEGH